MRDLGAVRVNRPDARLYLTVEEAARHAGLKEHTIRNLLSVGKLKTYKFKSLTLVKKKDLAPGGVWLRGALAVGSSAEL